jgi:hypothetical protein
MKIQALKLSMARYCAYNHLHMKSWYKITLFNTLRHEFVKNWYDVE